MDRGDMGAGGISRATRNRVINSRDILRKGIHSRGMEGVMAGVMDSRLWDTAGIRSRGICSSSRRGGPGLVLGAERR
jgi:hypothetical protein